MRKLVTIPVDVSDPEISIPGKGAWSSNFQMFLREWVFGWRGFDESTDMVKVSMSLTNKFVGKKPGDQVVLSENEWEQGKKALAAADIPAIFRGTLRPFRLAWLAAEDVKEEETVTNGAEKTAST